MGFEVELVVKLIGRFESLKVRIHGGHSRTDVIWVLAVSSRLKLKDHRRKAGGVEEVLLVAAVGGN